jgi:GlcNAc-P-P-Und epimerase
VITDTIVSTVLLKSRNPCPACVSKTILLPLTKTYKPLMKKILVSGGSGFIGTNLMDFYLHSDLDNSSILNIDTNKPRNWYHLSYWQQCSMLDLDSLTRIIQTFIPTHIFHMAARTDLNGKNIDAYDANTIGLENLISVCRTLPNLERIIFASSRLACRIGYQPTSDSDYCPTTP